MELTEPKFSDDCPAFLCSFLQQIFSDILGVSGHESRHQKQSSEKKGQRNSALVELIFCRRETGIK
jgi:hypothetical protein